MSIYFGSLEAELSEVVREEYSAGDSAGDKTTHTTKSTHTTHTHTTSTTTHTTQNSEFDRRALAKTLQIPTDDATTRSYLTLLNQPITLFGEGPAERRDRLRLMASRAVCSLPRALELFPILKKMLGGKDDTYDIDKDDVDRDTEESDDEEFYVPGSVDLVKVRAFLLQDSIARTRSHVKTLNHVDELARRTSMYCTLSKSLDLRSSHVDPAGRPLTSCAFTANGALVTGDLGGRVVEYSEGSKQRFLSESGDRITALCASSCAGNDLVMAGTATGSIHIYSRDSANALLDSRHPVKSLNWHPSALFFASTSADSLWRLWDAHQGAVIQTQEGHVGGIGAGAWHPHGGLYCTGGSVDGVVRVWDCRAGKAIWSITAGVPTTSAVTTKNTMPTTNTNTSAVTTSNTASGITGLAFSPQSPHLLASSTSDGLISFHDLRSLQAAYSKTAAHRSSCTALKFAGGGRVLVSSGFDGCVRVWSPGDLRLVRELTAGSGKVMDMDVLESDDSSFKIAAVTFDKAIKMYSC